MGLRRRLGLGGGRFFGPGELRVALLALLDEQPGHGYDLMTRLAERSGGAYRASAGAIYPTLQQLEDERLVRVEAEDGRKVYRLTAEGRRALAAAGDEPARIWARARQWSEWGLFGDPDAAEMVRPALRLARAALRAVIHAHGDPAVIDEVRAILDEARARIEQIGRRRR